MEHRKISLILVDLGLAKVSLASCLRAAGDDLGCDGTGAHAEALADVVADYEHELAAARAARAPRCVRAQWTSN